MGGNQSLREEGVIWLGFAIFLLIWCCTYNLYRTLLPLYKNKKCVIMFKWDNTRENKHFKILTKVWSLNITFLKPMDCVGFFCLLFPYLWTNNSCIFLKTKLSTNSCSRSLRKQDTGLLKTLTNILSCRWRNWENDM